MCSSPGDKLCMLLMSLPVSGLNDVNGSKLAKKRDVENFNLSSLKGDLLITLKGFGSCCWMTASFGLRRVYHAAMRLFESCCRPLLKCFLLDQAEQLSEQCVLFDYFSPGLTPFPMLHLYASHSFVYRRLRCQVGGFDTWVRVRQPWCLFLILTDRNFRVCKL